MFVFILKVLAIIGASFVAYGLATTKVKPDALEETHYIAAVVLELGALAITFLP